MATEAIYTKSLGGAEDLLLDASNSPTVIQTRAGKELEITKINSSTIPYSGKFGDPSMVSIKDQLESSAYVIDTVDDFGTVSSGLDTVIVKDLNRGGTFIYDATQRAVNNGGTVFDGWVRQYSGAVNVRWFGAKDYTNSPTFDNSTIINNTYIYCVTNSVQMVIDNNYYIEHSLIFSLRAGISGQYMISANCTIFSNIADTSPAVYIGDTSSHGIYNLNIDGMMIIRNISGAKRGVGCQLQQAAYGYYNVVCAGFDFGFKLEGAIFITIDGKGGNTSNNNIDIVIEPNQGIQGGLRHTNNVSKIINMSLNSSNKVLMRSGDGHFDVGGLIQFDNILFEGNTSSDYSNEATIVCRGTAEGVSSALGKIKFTNCWFEAFSNNKPIINAYGTDLILDYSFIANISDMKYYFKICNTSSIHFNDCTGYFYDSEPIALVGALTEGNITYRGQIFLNNTIFLGGAGTHLRIHDGLTSAEANQIRYFRGNGISTEVMMVGEGGVLVNDSTNNYMQNGTINITDFLHKLIGNNWEQFTLSISGSDGGSVNSVKIEGYKFPGGTQTYIYTLLRGTGLTTSDNITYSFPITLTAGWFKPTFALKASSISGYRSATV